MRDFGQFTVHSRHRLPDIYRYSLVIFWLLPGVIVLLAIVYGRGISSALYDPRFWLPLMVMSLPAVYIWQEGLDVVEGGIITRVHLPRYHAYTTLSTWDIHREPHGQMLSIWRQDRVKVYEGHASHLTHFPALTASLHAHVCALERSSKLARSKPAQASD